MAKAPKPADAQAAPTAPVADAPTTDAPAADASTPNADAAAAPPPQEPPTDPTSLPSKIAAAPPPQEPPTDPTSLPSKIKMLQPHGFIDDEGKHRYWQQSQVVFEPADIALLHERKANFEAVKDALAKQ